MFTTHEICQVQNALASSTLLLNGRIRWHFLDAYTFTIPIKDDNSPSWTSTAQGVVEIGSETFPAEMILKRHDDLCAWSSQLLVSYPNAQATLFDITSIDING